MGSTPPAKEERLLMIFPFPEPENLVLAIEKKHPNIKVTYKYLSINRKKAFNDQEKVPDGLHARSSKPNNQLTKA